MTDFRSRGPVVRTIHTKDEILFFSRSKDPSDAMRMRAAVSQRSMDDMQDIMDGITGGKESPDDRTMGSERGSHVDSAIILLPLTSYN